MALESATFINQLVASNPNGADPKGQGDDHLRMIKAVLKATFPNLTGAVQTTQDQINLLTNPNTFFQRGMIIMWSGDYSTIPSGWRLCDGLGGTPDLRDRFIVGAGASYSPGNVGGSASHTHGISVGNTALTEAQMPAHTHSLPAGSNDTVGTEWSQASPGNSGGRNAPSYYYQSVSSGGGQAHGHTATADGRDHRPPYMALCYLMRL